MALLAPVRTVAPTVLPLTLAEAKDHLLVSGETDDAYIVALVGAATEALDGWEGRLGRCLVTQTWRQDRGAFPSTSGLVLPFPDVASVAVVYSDASDVEQTLAASAYRLLPTTLGPTIFLKTDQTWPETYDREDAVRITMTCGYGAASAVPASIKQAMLMMIGAWFANRETVVVGLSVSSLPMPVGAEALLAPHCWAGF